MVGMSGGVDSSVAALMLRDQGVDVAGMTLRLCPDDPALTGSSVGCGSSDDVADAAAVCAALGIPHYVMDFTALFAERVMRPFADEYLRGRTPNPCVLCNPAIKFGAMLDRALDMGFDGVATGHYAQVVQRGGRWLLRRSPVAKDQSYVLYTLTQHQLAHIRFPLYALEKPQVRVLAAQANLPIAQKPDSEEICFVKDQNYVRFITQYTGKTAPEGDFVDSAGHVLGRHRGITHYTVGQRKGLGISFGAPMYVTRINAKKNQVVLGPEGSQYASELIAEQLNWIPFDVLTQPIRAEARIRYQAVPAPCRIEPAAGQTVRVVFDDPQRAITPGQSVVFTDGDWILGGGIIADFA